MHVCPQNVAVAFTDQSFNINDLKKQKIFCVKKKSAAILVEIKWKGRRPGFRNTKGKDMIRAEIFLIPLATARNILNCVNKALVNSTTNPYTDKCHTLTSVPAT